MKITIGKINDKNAQAEITVKVDGNTPAFKSKAPLFLLAKLSRNGQVGTGDMIDLG